jgi:CheY-like chemotaxis protein
MQTTTEPVERAATAQKVVVVNGTPEILELLETVLEAGRYDMVFVESSAHAYSRIRRVQPNLIILCMDLAELEGFHLLSMLKLDPETQRIPVVTYMGGGESNDGDDDPEIEADDDFPVVRPTMTMN